MSSFTHALVVEDLENGNWVVKEPFVYVLEPIPGVAHRFVAIPEGFLTDFASIPRGLWNVFPPNGCSYDRAAVVHDYLYRGGFVTQIVGNLELHKDPTRAEADSILKEAMNVSNVGWFTRQVVWAGVRVGGRCAWAKGHDVSKS